MDTPEKRNSEELRSLPERHGAYTVGMLESLKEIEPLSTADALSELTMEIVPFNERLTNYVSQRLGIADDVKSVKKALRQSGNEKGLGFSSANLSQWITKEKWEVYVSPRSIFKLCLAMSLDLAESQRFCFECLYQNWLNYRVAEEAIYIFFIGCQSIFGNETYAKAIETLEWFQSEIAAKADSSRRLAHEEGSAAGYTRLLGGKIRGLSESSFSSQDSAIEAFRTFLRSNSRLFTGIQRSAAETYDLYFREGGIGIRPLTEMYKDKYGLTLPETSYLDNAYVQEDSQRKRLLWGTMNRRAWLEDNERDLDVLQDREIRTEEHAIGRMRENGIPRGNMVALLFFHFCFENDAQMANGALKEALFDSFYQRTNIVLTDECGMMPLHPRKPLDGLFLRSIARSGSKHPIEYLNQVLTEFYSM